jgi:3-oxoacyl-[acyl-carrier protein] reductase
LNFHIIILVAVSFVCVHTSLAVPNNFPVPRFVTIKFNEVNARTGPENDCPIEWVFVKKSEPVEVIAEFGQVDICVNNAGISKDNLLLRMSVEQWNEVIQVNLNSVFNMTKQVIKPMMKAKSGSIINMSSVIGEMGNAGQASYAASKAGVIGFTKSVAKELGSRNIRCNAVAPGFVETDMTSYLQDGNSADKYKSLIPLGRFAAAEDIANVCLFLASDMGSYVTGQTISACGGMNI